MSAPLEIPDLLDRGQKSLTPAAVESAALAAAHIRIAELENEVKILRKAAAFYDWRGRPPPARMIRRAWLSDRIVAVREASRQTYGAPRVRAELVHSQGVVVSRKTVALPMRRAGTTGLPLRRKAKRVPAAVAVTDLVGRNFYRDGPNQPWVTDITEHPTQFTSWAFTDRARRAGLLPSWGTVGSAADGSTGQRTTPFGGDERDMVPTRTVRIPKLMSR